MQTDPKRPNRRPKLFLPLALSPRPEAERATAPNPFPLSPDQLRRCVAEMVG